MQIPDDLLYTKTHEWAKREATEVVVGITSHAQQELRDVVFVELPKVGTVIEQGQPAAVIESVKAAFDIYAPVSGTVSRINEAVLQSPQQVNQDCYGQGWLFAISFTQPSQFEQLLTAERYSQQIKAEAHS
ncbi:MAG: glycine cleavage system protein GcvH [Candidatus Omnitrophica bacterium]|nr:glycine cleavage system protein GcvH [Candidatus Omnitrophota bacterium]MBI2173726.1 glycine cleavage system protein GcvH [Candidatus Omnitrophota bacterium]MBI3009662.1 glycine cleavage system protein GcvH [Candidatus Omnitrophota bacterium]